MKQDISIMDH